MNHLRIGRSCQVAGVVLIVLALVVLGFLLIGPTGIWRRSSRLGCDNNLKRIGLAFRTWAIDNDGSFPFNVSTNAGGTREFCVLDSEGFDSNAALHFQVMSNELSTPRILVCPKDGLRKPVPGFQSLQANNISYRLHSGTNLNEGNPSAVLLLCPFDGNTVHCDGSVTAGKTDWMPPGMSLMDAVRYKYLDWLSVIGPVFMVNGVVLLWVGSRVAWKAKGGPKPMGLSIGEALLVIVAIVFIVFMLVGTV